MTDEEPKSECKFTGKVKNRGNDYVVPIPETEIEFGTLLAGDIVRISAETVERPVSSTPKEKTPVPSPGAVSLSVKSEAGRFCGALCQKSTASVGVATGSI